MVMKRFSIAILSLLAVFLIFSCASAPEEEPKEVEAEEPKTEEPAAPAPDPERAEAKSLRSLITSFEFEQYAQELFAEAEQSYETAEAAYGEDNEKAANEYRTAIEGYRNVLEKAVKARYEEWQREANTRLSEASEVKADKAVPEAYDSANGKLEKSREAYKNENYEEASTLYKDGMEELEEAVSTAREKRRKALNALEETEKSMKQSEERIRKLEEDMDTEQDETDEESGSAES